MEHISTQLSLKEENIKRLSEHNTKPHTLRLQVKRKVLSVLMVEACHVLASSDVLVFRSPVLLMLKAAKVYRPVSSECEEPKMY